MFPRLETWRYLYVNNTKSTDNEGRVREVIDTWYAAVKAKDADKLLSISSSDAVVFPAAMFVPYRDAKSIQ